MYLYLVRHGETNWNKEKLFQGGTDIPLNDEGREQARQAAARLAKAGVSFDKVISSPLARAVETASLLSGERECDIITDDRIREMSFGSLEGTDYYLVKDQNALLFNDPMTYKPECGEETYENLYGRVRSFIEDIRSGRISAAGNMKNRGMTAAGDMDSTVGNVGVKSGDCKDEEFKLLISTHGACMRALLTVLRNTDPNLMWKVSVGNCQFFKFRLYDGMFTEVDASDINREIVNGNV